MSDGQIPVVDAQAIGVKHDLPVVVVFAIHGEGEGFSTTTWGRTKKLCRLAASYGQQLSEAILSGEVIPPQAEPFELPDSPEIVNYNWKEDDPCV